MKNRKYLCYCAYLCVLAAFLANANPSFAQAPDPAKDPSPEWDDLSKQIIPEVLKHNADFGSIVRNVRKAQCKIDVQFSSNAAPGLITGLMSYAWEDANNNGFLSANEIDIETKEVSNPIMEPLLGDVRKQLETEITYSATNIFKLNHVKTAKKDDVYIMRLKPISEMAIKMGLGPKASYSLMYLTVSSEYKTTYIKTKNALGTDTTTTLKHAKFGDVWFATGWSQRTPTPDGGAVEEERTDTLEELDGVPVLKSIVAETAMTNICRRRLSGNTHAGPVRQRSTIGATSQAENICGTSGIQKTRLTV